MKGKGRGKGLGKVIMLRMLKYLRTSGYTSVRLVSSPEAIGFYLKAGFKKVSSTQHLRKGFLERSL